jgi:hypothetical protein
MANFFPKYVVKNCFEHSKAMPCAIDDAPSGHFYSGHFYVTLSPERHTRQLKIKSINHYKWLK